MYSEPGVPTISRAYDMAAACSCANKGIEISRAGFFAFASGTASRPMGFFIFALWPRVMTLAIAASSTNVAKYGRQSFYVSPGSTATQSPVMASMVRSPRRSLSISAVSCLTVYKRYSPSAARCLLPFRYCISKLYSRSRKFQCTKRTVIFLYVMSHIIAL